MERGACPRMILRGKNIKVRSEVAYTLKDIGEPEDIPLLEKMLASSDREASDNAYLAIDSIRHRFNLEKQRKNN